MADPGFVYGDTVLPPDATTSAGLVATPSNGGTEGTPGSGLVPQAQRRHTARRLREPARDVEVLADVDVLVCGGGPAGTAAAVAAARAGARTLLIERYGFLGGMATAGMVVPHFNPHHNGGINAEVIAQLIERRAWGAEGWRISFDPERWKHVSEDLVLDSGSDLLYHTFAVATLKDGHRVCGVVVETKSGRFAITADVVVDCTGDGDVAARAGAEFEKGRPGDGLMQPMTTMFRLGGVRWVQTKSTQMWQLVQDAIDRTGHHFRLPYEYPWTIHLPNPDEVAVQLAHVRRADGTDVRDLSRAEVEGRRQTAAVVDFLTQHVDEFADAYLIETAPQIGIRETRRILGDYVLTGEDLTDGRTFTDAIATVSFGIDIHSPDEIGGTGLPVGTGNGRRGAYDVPYRCLLPRGLDQLLVAGRCISGTFEAHASYRVKGPCMAMGQAAGAAAAIAVRSGSTVRDVPVSELHRVLRQQGFKLWDAPHVGSDDHPRPPRRRAMAGPARRRLPGPG